MSPPVQEQRRPARLTLSSFRVLIWTSSSFRTLSCSHKRLKVTCGGGGTERAHTHARACVSTHARPTHVHVALRNSDRLSRVLQHLSRRDLETEEEDAGFSRRTPGTLWKNHRDATGTPTGRAEAQPDGDGHPHRWTCPPPDALLLAAAPEVKGQPEPLHMHCRSPWRQASASLLPCCKAWDGCPEATPHSCSLSHVHAHGHATEDARAGLTFPRGPAEQRSSEP